MKFSYNWLKEFVPFRESPEKLAELLTLRSFEVESVEKVHGDWLLNVALLPNRIPDASGHIGIAKEIAAVGNYKVKEKVLETKKYSSGIARQMLDVQIEKGADCARYVALVIDGVRVKESPEWMKKRLELLGLQSINNLVDAANFIMLETGQPLHVFDYSKLDLNNNENRKREFQISKFQIQNKLKTIVVRRAKKGEKILALDDKEYALSPEILVIADSKNPAAIAGIKGGKDSGVSSETRTIVLEAANFDPAAIRGGSKILGIKTDASYRFEHGIDPNLSDFAMRRLADLILRLSGGESKGMIDVYPKKVEPTKRAFRIEYANRLIGEDIPREFYLRSLTNLGMRVEEKNRSELIVEIPTVRRDIVCEEDLIEEAGRLYGYEKISAKLPDGVYVPSEGNSELFLENKIRDIASGFGFTESYAYEFTGDRELEDFEESALLSVELGNPTSPETKYLLRRPLTKYVRQVSENLRHFDSVKLFGIAKSFSLDHVTDQRHGLVERKQLVLAVAEKGESGEGLFYELKGAIDGILEALGITEHIYGDVFEPGKGKDDQGLRMFHPHRAATIRIGDESIGMIGEIRPAVLERMKTKARVTAVQIDIQSLTRLVEDESEYRQISKYPTIIRDVAVIVPFNLKMETVLNVIENAGGEMLVDTDLFDYFYDEDMRHNDKKSLAFHLKFESADRTLTDKEVNGIMEKIVTSLETRDWAVRK